MLSSLAALFMHACRKDTNKLLKGQIESHQYPKWSVVNESNNYAKLPMLLCKDLKVQKTGYHILCAAFQPSKMGYIENTTCESILQIRWSYYQSYVIKKNCEWQASLNPQSASPNDDSTALPLFISRIQNIVKVKKTSDFMTISSGGTLR